MRHVVERRVQLGMRSQPVVQDGAHLGAKLIYLLAGSTPPLQGCVHYGD
jgi:hypothetical protein